MNKVLMALEQHGKFLMKQKADEAKAEKESKK